MSSQPIQPQQQTTQNNISNPNANQNNQPTVSSKPITATFDLQTKIRVIIQQVLVAVMRKISQFHEKVESFEKFFFTYTQRMNDIEEKGKTSEQSIMRMFESITKNKEHSQNQFIKIEQKYEKLRIEKNKIEQDIKQLYKKINTINRQNQNIINQFSNTKKKFLEYSEQMSAMKQQVSWKITKYVQQTAEINTKIQVSNEQMKKQYFNISLALQKNKEKYQQIMSAKDHQDSLNQRYSEAISILQTDVKTRGEQIVTVNKKLQDMDTALYTKMRNTQLKLQKKVQQLSESNMNIQKSVLKVDGFSKILQQVRQDSQQVRRQLLKKFEESDQKHNDAIQKQVLVLNTNILNFQKSTDKKIRTINENQQKNVEYFDQKMQYLKIQIQSSISTKASRMLQQKSKNQSGIATSQFVQLQEKLNKLNLEVKKEINKMQNTVKQVKLQIKHQLQETKESVEAKITSTVKAIQQSSGSGVSPQFIKTINQKIQKSNDVLQMKLFEFSKQINDQTLRIKQIQNMKAQTQVLFANLTQSSQKNFLQLEQKISNKVQRVLYTVTKMRSDAIIRNQFTDKQIKQLKKISSTLQRQIFTVLKLLPAVGQCINLIMCLIFDAEYQHSKIIQDSLPNINKNDTQFRNVVEGVLYQFMQKKKAGYILYRHKQQKKTQIVKATFTGYIKIWEDLFTNDFKNKQQLIPKSFYLKYVQKNIGRNSSRNSPNKDNSQPNNVNKQYGSNSSIMNNSRQNLMRHGDTGENSTEMNKSFQIKKKKKISTIRSKDDLIMVVQQKDQK